MMADDSMAMAGTLPRRSGAKHPRLLSAYLGFASATAALRYQPHFLIIGTQKGGTSSLYQNLIRHPEVVGALGKELHFFDANFSRGEAWYRAHFPLRLNLKALSALGRGQRVVTGEASPEYLYFPYVAERVAGMSRNAKFIVMLRDPVSRAYSGFHMEARRGRVSETAAVELSREARFLEAHPVDRVSFERYFYDWAQRWSGVFRTILNEYPRDLSEAKSSMATELPPYGSMGCLLRSLYYFQMQAWFERFPREQFLVIDSRDYFAAPLETIEKVVAPFLGLSGWKPDRYVESTNEGRSYPKIDPALRHELAAFFKPYNEKLYGLLGTDFGW